MKKEKIINFLIFIIIIGFLFYYFKPSLIFSSTTLSGGDTGSHNYLAKFMRENLLTKLKITGWSDGWYAGFPIFRFYFPFLYFLNAALSFFINQNVSFKIITLLGTFLLPFCAYYCFRLMKFEFPYPIMAAVFTLPFLFLENNSMYGGNIPSTLAGEFTYSFALALSLLFVCLCYSGITNYKDFILSVVLLSVIVLSHVIPVVVLTFSCILYLAFFNKRELKYGMLVFIFAFFLIAFWTIPFLFYSGLTTSLKFIPDKSLKLLVPENILFLLPFFVLGLFFMIRKNDKRILFFFVFTLVSLMLFFFIPKGHIWNVRFLPFYYLGISMIAAYCVGYLYHKVKLRSKYLIPIFIAVIAVILISSNVGYIGNWIKWNYSGFENKDKWDVFNEMNLFLNNLPEGRVFFEYSGSHNEYFGTPRAFELIPFFTNKATMEGLLIESGINAPYHFYLQSETTTTPTCPISGLRCSSLDIDNAYKHFELFNIKYFAVTSDKVKNLLENDSRFELLKEIEFINVYELKRNSRYVDFLKYKPVLMDKKDFKEISLDWFKGNRTDVEIIYNNWDVSDYRRVYDLDDVNYENIDYNDCYINEDYKIDKIFLKTNCIGKPLLVKISHFPGWKINGGKLYLASPAFMILIPEKENVEIYYGNTFVNYTAIILSIIALIILIFYKKLKILN